MMKHSKLLIPVLSLLVTATCVAADFGAHVGYYDNDAKKAYIGVDLGLPIGPVALMPNIDYWRQNGYGYWIGNADVNLKWTQSNGPSFWVGAGPTYARITGSGSGSGTGGYAFRGSPFDYTPSPSPSPTPTPTPGTPPNTGAVTTGGVFGNGKNNAWGWDVNGGVAFGAIGGNFRPYITGRYNKVKDYTAAGVAVGLRFGH